MSSSRQSRSWVRSYAITHPPGRVALPTEPGWDRVVFSRTGHFTARSPSQHWTIPAHRALSVPDGTQLQIETGRRCAIRCVYLRSELEVVGPTVRVVGLNALTAALLTHAVDVSPMELADPADAALVTLLAAQLGSEPDVPLRLPLPSDPAARTVATAIIQNPTHPLDELIKNLGAGRRTIERRFRTDTAMSLGQWRRRARVLRAVAMLADDHSVTAAATAVGYATPSSFVAAFRSELDAPPRAFMLTHNSATTAPPATRRTTAKDDQSR